MRVSTILSALGTIALAGKSNAAATPAGANDSPGIEAELIAEGYQIIPPTFTGAFGPDGKIMTFNGTVEEVMRQVHDIYPGYDFDTADTALMAHNKGDWRDLEVAKKDCDGGGRARGIKIQQGIQYLRGLKGECNLDRPGCTRVSCSWDSAIWVCWDPKDDPNSTYQKPWSYVADYAQGICAGEWCPRMPSPSDPTSLFMARGKVWDPKGMAVHVGKDRC